MIAAPQARGKGIAPPGPGAGEAYAISVNGIKTANVITDPGHTGALAILVASTAVLETTEFGKAN